MIKILLIENEDDLRDVLGFFLESEFGAEVEFARSVLEASIFFKTRTDFSAVVCDYTLADGTGEDAIKALRSEQKDTPFILFGSYHPESYSTFQEFKVDGFVSKSELFEKMKPTIEGVLVNIKDIREKQVSIDYCRIRVETILKLGVLTCDFYLRLPQNRYVRVLREGDVFEAADFNRFTEKSVEFLYIKAKDRLAFLGKLSQDLLQLSLLKSAPTEAIYQISKSTLEVIADVTQRFGFTEEAHQVAKANVTLAVKNIQKNPDLSPLFEDFISDPDSYIASHSVLLAYICCGVSSLMGWKSDMTFYKLTLAAFLHDILLKNPQLAEIQRLDELANRSDEFTDEEKETYLSHPTEGAKLLHSAKDIPLDVDIIILQHHERPDGKGFPGRLNYMKISPLSAVFILAHDMLCFHKKNPVDPHGPDVVDFVKGLSVEYSKGYFKSLVQALSQSAGLKHKPGT